ncbi:uncharacterized protein LOC113121998 isoform X2 [Mastacembelus armatus]|uniref:uncharacterized protein LOC113121998 isoform X2 n=1 Tax=Mastacembelus armatus TaxID=205130 RepID=UPI000E456463|nr:uncharacterized protein LOC113121998 isoform X2 [Mastacembelus armatus]
METEYPTLKRPRRRLWYLTDKESSKQQTSEQCPAIRTLDDIDKMFDDLDSSLHDEELLSSPLVLQISDTIQGEEILAVTQDRPGPEGDVKHHATSSPSSKLDTGLNIPFKVHEPVKTSSPIEEKKVVEQLEEEEKERALVVPSILVFEDDEIEKAEAQPNSHIQCNRQDNTDQHVTAVSQEPELQPPVKKSENVCRQLSAERATSVGKDIQAFLLKLRDAGVSKPTCTRKILSPVKVPMPPEPEDDFLFMEEEDMFYFSIPSKTSTRKSQRQKEPKKEKSSKDSSMDKAMKGSSLERAEKEEESEKANTKMGSQSVNQKMRKNEGKEKRQRKKMSNETTAPGIDELSVPEDLPAGDFEEQEKSNKKRLQELSSKRSVRAEAERKGSERNAQKSLKAISSNYSRDRKEHAKTSRSKSLKGARKVIQGSDDTGDDMHVKEQDEAHMNKKNTDLDFLLDQEIMHSEAQTVDLPDGKQNNIAVVSEGILPEDGQILGKRKREPPGRWWLTNQQTIEEKRVAENKSIFKTPKWHKKEPSATACGNGKTIKDKVLNSKNQKPHTPSGQKTRTYTKRRTKPKKNRITEGDTAGKMEAEEAFNKADTACTEDQDQKLADQDLDLVQSSSCSNADHLFWKNLLNISNKKMSNTQMPAYSRGHGEQLREAQSEKRRRKPPGNWWEVGNTSADMECMSLQPHQLHEPKPCKEKRKKSKRSKSVLGSPKNGNISLSSKPLGGAPVPPLKTSQLLTTRTVKSSLATFKDIFTSATQADSVVGNKVTPQNSRCNITACSDKAASAQKRDSLQNNETPKDSFGHLEITLKDLVSGPSSMIQLEEYEEYDDFGLPTSRTHAVLCASDLCAPPLKPLILHPKDEAGLTVWFKNFCSFLVHNGAEITPNQFDWYIYQERAIGFLMDMNCGSLCNGKMFLSSYTKKPLWVDHSALTVFNILTSSVNVIINSKKFHFNAGQAFVVKCGHAYSIQNVTAQPALLFFTRILAESVG